MAIQLNHTIVSARDPRASAEFLAEILGLPPPVPFGPFLGVQTDNGVTLDYLRDDDEFPVQHFAFLVTEEEFDVIFGRIQARGLAYWADPGQKQPGRINHGDGGRGVYWDDPDGHRLEILTRPYGSGGDLRHRPAATCWWSAPGRPAAPARRCWRAPASTWCWPTGARFRATRSAATA